MMRDLTTLSQSGVTTSDILSKSEAQEHVRGGTTISHRAQVSVRFHEGSCGVPALVEEDKQKFW